MIPEKGKRYLLVYHFDDYYTDIGTYTGETWREEDRLEYRFKVDGGTLLATEEDIKKCIDNPHDGSTLDNFLLLEEYNKLKAITDRILREFPVGNIAEHTIESIPDRISYYLKELAEYTQKLEDLEDKKLDPKQPICTKCINNLTYYDGWHCMCEVKDIDRNCWVNFDNSWEECADRLIHFAEIVKATEGNSTRNPEYYNRACEIIEEYKRLKNG